MIQLLASFGSLGDPGRFAHSGAQVFRKRQIQFTKV